jgi:predicted DNA-binding protein with PD1-like motif
MPLPRKKPSLLLVAFVSLSNGCAPATLPAALPGPSLRWLKPAEVVPHGAAPGAQHRQLASHEDGAKDYALILRDGDEVWSALVAFAQAEKVTSARFTAIGAVRDPEVGWFDPAKKQYKAMALEGAQGEVLALVGDIGLNAKGDPVVHAHLVFGRADGSTFGGHLMHATTSPTLEVFVTTFPSRLEKKVDPQTDLTLFDLAAPER